jgi:hypothetical protein
MVSVICEPASLVVKGRKEGVAQTLAEVNRPDLALGVHKVQVCSLRSCMIDASSRIFTPRAKRDLTLTPYRVMQHPWQNVWCCLEKEVGTRPRNDRPGNNGKFRTLLASFILSGPRLQQRPLSHREIVKWKEDLACRDWSIGGAVLSGWTVWI